MNNFQRNIYRSAQDAVVTILTDPISLGFSETDSATSCSNFVTSPVTRYIPQGEDWTIVSFLYQNASGTVPAQAGYYSDGGKWYFWNGVDTFTSTAFC